MRRDEFLRPVEAPQPPQVDRAMWSEGSLTVSQAAKFLATSRKTVFTMMGDGRLPWGRLGCHRRIPKQAVLDLLSGGGG